MAHFSTSFPHPARVVKVRYFAGQWHKAHVLLAVFRELTWQWLGSVHHHLHYQCPLALIVSSTGCHLAPFQDSIFAALKYPRMLLLLTDFLSYTVLFWALSYTPYTKSSDWIIIKNGEKMFFSSCFRKKQLFFFPKLALKTSEGTLSTPLSVLPAGSVSSLFPKPQIFRD